MRNFFKSYINGTPFYDLLSHINNRNHPYAFLSKIFSPDSVSDFFFWSNHFSKIKFHAENVFALYSRSNFLVSHHFNFYSSLGDQIFSYSHESSDFVSKITLPIPESSQFGSFTHFCIPQLNHSFFYQRPTFQSRGYTSYHLADSSFGSIAHGNFGGLTYSSGSVSVPRSSFSYTPPFQLSKSNTYDFSFGNPTSQQISVSLYLNDSLLHDRAIIPPFGTHLFSVRNVIGYASFLSHLPIGRPTIFVNINNPLSFDVLHA